MPKRSVVQNKYEYWSFAVAGWRIHQLTLIDQHDLDNGVQRNVDLVRAHAVRSAVRRSIVTVAELLRIDFVVLRDERRRRRQVRDLVDQRDDVIAGRCDCWCAVGANGGW